MYTLAGGGVHGCLENSLRRLERQIRRTRTEFDWTTVLDSHFTLTSLLCVSEVYMTHYGSATFCESHLHFGKIRCPIVGFGHTALECASKRNRKHVQHS